MPFWERLDPVHEMSWSDTINSSWFTVGNVEHDYRVTPSGALEQYSHSVFSPIQLPQHRMYSPLMIQCVALLNEWNQLTTFQIATLLGVGRHKVWRYMNSLYDMGIVMRMIPSWWRDDETPEETGTGSIWRINRKSWTLSDWLEKLDPLNWMLLTNNADPRDGSVGSNSPMAMRHNVGMVDLIIKAMETIPEIVGGWGEAHCVPSLFYDQTQYETDAVRGNVGDGMLVTGNGKMIIFESSGSASINKSTSGNRLVEKAAAWTSICGKSDFDLNVVFLEMSTNPRMSHMTDNIKYGASEVSQKYVANRKIRERGQSKIFVANAWDWFPMARVLNEEFRSLTCVQPTTGQVVNLVDDSDRSIDPHNDVVVNTLAALHTPHWIHDPIQENNHKESAS